jgi:hypothetical protein
MIGTAGDAQSCVHYEYIPEWHTVNKEMPEKCL